MQLSYRISLALWDVRLDGGKNRGTLGFALIDWIQAIILWQLKFPRVIPDGFLGKTPSSTHFYLL